MPHSRIAILHYSAPPVIGGVEAVIKAHARTFTEHGYATTVIAGRGSQEAVSAKFISVPELDSQNPQILRVSAELETGRIPQDFEEISSRIVDVLTPIVQDHDQLIIHNIFTKHFNLPLTVALSRLLDQDLIKKAIAWCHDFTWTSENSRYKVHPGYPWDLLRTAHPKLTYVVVSRKRQEVLAELMNRPINKIQLIYNGVDVTELLGLSTAGAKLAKRLKLLDSDLTLIMPVRITPAKNIEYALRFVSSLKSLGRQPKLVITGPPDPHDANSMHYYQSLKDLRQKLDLENEVHFIFESGSDPKSPNLISASIVGDLFRLSDAMFMPSHREGFGMPVLEAGLAGIPVIATAIPAAVEIGRQDVMIFDLSRDSDGLAQQMLTFLETNPIANMRHRMRRQYTWDVIFRRQIQPLIE